MDSFRIDDRQIEQLAKKLAAFSKHALPVASLMTLNRMAFQGRAYAQEIIGEKMVLRNQWTARSVQVDQAKGTMISAQRAVLGSTEPYMATQEFGGSEQAKGKHGVPIPTTSSSGEAMSAVPRRKQTRRAYRLPNIKLERSELPQMSLAQRRAVSIAMAIRSGKRLVYLDLGRRRGLFRVTGAKSRAKIRMIWDLSHKSVTIPAHEWLGPAADRARKDGPAFGRESLLLQAKHFKLIP